MKSEFDVTTVEGLQRLFDDIAARTKPDDLTAIRSLREELSELDRKAAEASLKWVNERNALNQRLDALVKHLPRGAHRNWAGLDYARQRERSN